MERQQGTPCSCSVISTWSDISRDRLGRCVAGTLYLSSGLPLRVIGVYTISGSSLPGFEGNTFQELVRFRFIQEHLQAADAQGINALVLGDSLRGLNSVQSPELDCWPSTGAPTRWRPRMSGMSKSLGCQSGTVRLLSANLVLLYKWDHSRQIIGEALVPYYLRLLRRGWRLTRDELKRDVQLLLGGSYEAFMARARRGLTTFCQKLLEHNFLKEATVRTVSNSGESAVHIAAKHGWPSTVTALVKHPRMRELARSTNGRTPLHCAAEEGHSLVVKALLACPNFEDVNVQDTLGYTALHLAASQGHAVVCSILLGSSRFTSANVKDWKGWTALHCAAEHGHDEACSALLGSGRCHVAAIQQDCLSALQLARGRGHVSTCELLRLHPAFSEPGTSSSDDISAKLAMNLHSWCSHGGR
eukprot:s120_g32.t1